QTAAIRVGTGDAGGAAHDDVIGTAGTLAAGIERGKKVVVATVRIDVRSLDGRVRCTLSNAVARRVRGQLLPGGWIDLNQLDTGPEGTERKPPVAGRINHQGGINGIVVGT